MDLSRALVGVSDFAAARQYAEKGVAAVAKMKKEATGPDAADAARQSWLATMDASTKKNLEWVNQMIAWRDQQVRSGVLRKQ
jgi:hypothetical protein